MRRSFKMDADRTVTQGSLRRGFALVWTAVLLVVILGFTGLAVDTGYCVVVANQLHNAADAAALAGAQQIFYNPTALTSTAVSVAAANKAGGVPVQLDGSDVVVGRYDLANRTFTPGAAVPNAVKATARRTAGSPGGPLTLFFGAAFGAPTVDITRSSIAVNSGNIPAKVIVLNDDPNVAPFTVTGNSSLIVNSGAIQVNSHNNGALTVKGGGTLHADAIRVAGTSRVSSNASVTPAPTDNAPVVADPYIALPAPTFPAGQPGINVSTGETITLSPGYYTDGIRGNGGTVNLNPGIYILGGQGLRLTSQTTINGTGVMLYITGTGSVDMTGGSAVNLSPPDATRDTFPGATTYDGITIYQDRADTQAASLTGTASSNLQGVIYIPSAATSLNGGGSQMAISLVVNSLTISGTGTLTVGPHTTPIGESVYLVK